MNALILTDKVEKPMRRLIESINLRVQKAVFTGELEPVEKQTDAIAAADLELHERRNIV